MRSQASPALSLVPAAYVILLRQTPVLDEGAGALPGPGTDPGRGPARPAADVAHTTAHTARHTARHTASPTAARTEVLLQLRQATGYMDGHWACGAAGHVSPGESVVAAAARETLEETGAVVAQADLEPLTALHRSNDVGGPALEQRVDFFFTARRWSGQPRIRESARAAAMEWFPLTRLPSPVPPHELYVLRLLAQALDGGTPVPAVATFGFTPEQSAVSGATTSPR